MERGPHDLPKPDVQHATVDEIFAHNRGYRAYGAMACLLVMLSLTPAPSSLSEYALMRAAMGGIATWIFLPSLALTLIAGLLAIAVNRAYHSAGWAWAKLATGVLIFEWGFMAIQGPMQQEAELSARALTGEVDTATLAGSLGAERTSLNWGHVLAHAGRSVRSP